MQQQNNSSSNKYINAYSNQTFDERMEQMMLRNSNNDINIKSFYERVSLYEEQFSECSKRKEQLLLQLNTHNKSLSQIQGQVINGQSDSNSKKGFQKLEYLRQELIQTNLSINMNQSANTISDFISREVLGDKRQSFSRACENKSFGFIACNFSNPQPNYIERNQEMENLSLKLIPQSPKVVQNFIIYKAK